MVNSELIEYIKLERTDGTSHEKIRDALLKNGWNISDLEEAYRVLKINGPILPEFKGIHIPKEDKKPAHEIEAIKISPEIMAQNVIRFTPTAPEVILRESAEKGVPSSASGTVQSKSFLNLFKKKHP